MIVLAAKYIKKLLPIKISHLKCFPVLGVYISKQATLKVTYSFCNVK